MLRRPIATLALALAAFTAAPAAHAQHRSAGGLGSAGQLVLAGERLFGLYSFSSKYEDDDSRAEDSSTMVSFLVANPTSGVAAINPASIPRVGIDYLPIDVLTIGGNIGLWSASGHRKFTNLRNNNVNEGDYGDVSGFTIGPRVGGAFAINDIFTIWPRGGITYYSSSYAYGFDNRDKTKDSGLLLEVECVFAILPAHNFGFGFSPLLELPLSGTRSSERTQNGRTVTVEDTYRFTNFGVTASVLGYFLGVKRLV